MKKQNKLISLCLCAALTGVCTAAAAAENVNISFIVGENKVSINNTETEVTAPYIVNGTTLVPLRVISEGLGADVDWNEETNTVTVTDVDKIITLQAGNTSASINGSDYELLAAPELKEDTTMVPIRFISEAFDADVQWEQESRRVTVTGKTDNVLARIDNTKWNYNAEDGVYWQTGIPYCSNPADTQYETMGIFVPEQYMNAADNGDGTFTCTLNNDTKIGDYTADTAPIVIPVNTPGYSAMKAPMDYVKGVKSYTDAGFIYVNPGCRGRDEGAPAGVTDLKAAVKYIRYNDGNTAGDTDRIFTFGMSGGGAQSALMGATGDSDLYAPYLEAIGAVDGYSDAVTGSMCWCPITNLDYANEAYEWNMGVSRSELDEETQTLSDGLANAFAEYINDLGLKDKDGNVLTLEESESGIYMAGSYYDYLKDEIETSLNNFLADTTFPYTPQSFGMMGGRPGGNMQHPDEIPIEAIDGVNRPENNTDKPAEAVTYQTVQEYIDSLNKDIIWISYDSVSNTATITGIEDFVRVCKKASKSVGAFDDIKAAQAENTLFGYGDGKGAHFDPIMANLLKDTEYGSSYAADLAKTDSLGNTVDYRMNMYNPMYYLSDYYSGYNTSNVAKYWRIRAGINQGDTAMSTETNLALALESLGADVDFETIWGQGHVQAERTGDSTANFISWVNECLK